MASHRSLILARIAELLAGHGGPEDLSVQRTRVSPLATQNLPASIVYPTREDPETDDHDLSGLRLMTVRIEHRVKTPGDHPAADGTPPDDVLDPLLEWATDTLRSNRTLDGLVQDVEEVRLAWDFGEGDLQMAAVGQDFRVAYWDPNDA